MAATASSVLAMTGRRRELATLVGLLEHARQGRGHAAVVYGEAGIGKTTLARVLADAAEARGMATTWCWCPAVGSLAYFPWRPLLRRLGLSEPERSRGSDGEFDRQAVFASIVDGLADLGRTQPNLIIFEDAHAADVPSLTLLRMVIDAVRSLPVCVAVTARDDPLEMPSEITAALRDLPASTARLTLGPMPTDEVRDLLTAVVGERPDRARAEAIRHRTGGNPFLVTEVGRLWGTSTPDALPHGARDLLQVRIDRLEPPVKRALTAAAITGDPIDTALLSSMLRTSEQAIAALLDGAVRAKVLYADDGGGLRFAHALIAEVLTAGTPAPERARWHERAARALGDRADPEPAVIAHHWSRSLGPNARSQAATWSLAEARQARQRLGFEQAVAAYRRALDAAGEDRLTLMLEYAEAQRLAGDLSGSRATCLAVARAASAADRPEMLAAAALELGGGMAGFEVALRDEEQVTLLRESLAALPDGDSELRAAVLARLSLAVTELGEEQERRTMAEAAVAMANRLGTPSVRVAALAAFCDAISGPGDVAPRLAAAAEMRHLADAAGDRVGQLLARRLTVVALAERGELTAADAEGFGYARLAQRHGVLHYQWLPPVWAARRHLLAGAVDAALRAADEAEEIGGRAGSVNARYMAWVIRWHGWYQRGTLGDHRDDLRRGFAELVDLPNVFGGLAICALEAGDVVEARRLLRAATDIGLDVMSHDSEWLVGAWWIGEAAIRLGDVNAAQAAYAAILPYRAVFAVEGLAAAVMGVADHVLGRLAAFLGDEAAARQHLRRALDAHSRTASPVLIAATENAIAAMGDTAAGEAPAATDAGSGEFRRAGRIWRLAYRGQSAVVPDSKGMADLADLLRARGREIHVLDLVDRTGTARATAAGAGERIDAKARAAYRDRLAAIEDELAEAETNADVGRADRLRSEREFLTAELANALGLYARARTAADPAERARKAVAMRIATAIRAIEQVHEPLARHLRLSVATGRYCSYRPEQSVRWRT